jgi:uncharacterized protein (DUF885 family)
VKHSTCPSQIVASLASLAVLWTLGASPLGAQVAPTETERLNSWFEEQFEDYLVFHPIEQTYVGRRSALIDDFSIAGLDAEMAWQRASVAEMRQGFDYDRLTDEAKESWALWEYRLTTNEAALPFRDHVYRFDQFSAWHAEFPRLLITFHEVERALDMEAYIARINGSARAIRQLIERSRLAADQGIRPPAFSFGLVISEARQIISGVPFDVGPDDSAIWADIRQEVDSLLAKAQIDGPRAQELREEARSALVGPFRMAYEELIAWQTEDRVNATADAEGAWSLPNGAAYYSERLRNQTTTTLPAEEIHEIGLRDVARLRTAMESIAEQVGFQGDLSDFFVQLREDTGNPTLFFPDTDEGRQGYLDGSKAAIERIRAELPNYFGILPTSGIEVRRVEPFREQPGAAQHYVTGTLDGSRPGIYYAHLSDMTAMPKIDLEVTAYHEGIPGHHMQLSIALEATGLPTFRRHAWYGAYGEGWALYSEPLAKEMPGTYTDPYSEFGRLGSEIWRAARLVVDTGLHSRGWSEEQAVEYFLANSSATEGGAHSEIQRYLVSPGQATSYKIGMLKIQGLREKAEVALGDEFDIRDFHDVILGGGALPLSLLESRVDRWIASRLD